jgi:membrane carboxypeptidase/penicillin-binding protein
VVWVGYDEPATIGLPSSQGALPIWTDFMSEVLGDHVRGAFPRPAGIEEAEVHPPTGALALRGCPVRAREIFVKGTLPKETCPEGARAGEQRPGVFRRTLKRFFGP